MSGSDEQLVGFGCKRVKLSGASEPCPCPPLPPEADRRGNPR